MKVWSKETVEKRNMAMKEIGILKTKIKENLHVGKLSREDWTGLDVNGLTQVLKSITEGKDFKTAKSEVAGVRTACKALMSRKVEDYLTPKGTLSSTGERVFESEIENALYKMSIPEVAKIYKLSNAAIKRLNSSYKKGLSEEPNIDSLEWAYLRENKEKTSIKKLAKNLKFSEEDVNSFIFIGSAHSSIKEKGRKFKYVNEKTRITKNQLEYLLCQPSRVIEKTFGWSRDKVKELRFFFVARKVVFLPKGMRAGYPTTIKGPNIELTPPEE